MGICYTQRYTHEAQKWAKVGFYEKSALSRKTLFISDLIASEELGEIANNGHFEFSVLCSTN
jgi:hypothetical protein